MIVHLMRFDVRLPLEPKPFRSVLASDANTARMLIRREERLEDWDFVLETPRSVAAKCRMN